MSASTTRKTSLHRLRTSGPPADADLGSLFAFAKVSLLHAATSLRGMGARLEIVPIVRPA